MTETGPTAQRILIGYGPDDSARDALTLGRSLAGATGSELVLVSVYVDEPAMSDEYRAVCRQEAADRVDSALATLASSGLASRGVAHPSRSAAHGLADLAVQESAQLAVIGSRHTTPLGKLLSGAVTERLFAAAPCPVAVAPRGLAEHGHGGFERIGAGYDGSPEAGAALAEAERLVQASGAELRVLVICDSTTPPGLERSEREELHREREPEAAALLEQALGTLGEVERASGEVVTGEPARALAAAAEAQALDLLVIGSRGYGPFHGVVSGSVSSHLARHAPCPLVVVSDAESDAPLAQSSVLG
jgi:nucleotide-binding universal stress UspA family protein